MLDQAVEKHRGCYGLGPEYPRDERHLILTEEGIIGYLVQKLAFARSAGTEDGEDLAVRDLERYVAIQPLISVAL